MGILSRNANQCQIGLQPGEILAAELGSQERQPASFFLAQRDTHGAGSFLRMMWLGSAGDRHDSVAVVTSEPRERHLANRRRMCDGDLTQSVDQGPAAVEVAGK